MRIFAAIAAVLAAVLVQASWAQAAPTRTHPRVLRSARGTIVQPTRTIIHNANGTTTIIVTPRRSYLDPGTEVSPGDNSIMDYMLPPTGDPGRPNWWYGPDVTGSGGYPLNTPFYLPGFNPDTPF